MTLDSAKLRNAIESITDLPTLPTVIAKINAQIASPSTNAADIGKLIEQDQALTSKVLRLVNSAYYGFPKQIKSIQHAVVILGFNKVKTIVTTATVFDMTKRKNKGGLDIRRFWQHSLGVAVASKIVAEWIGINHFAEEAFIGGLLHDFGKIILDQYQPNIYLPVVRYANDKGILLYEAENELIGVSHTDVGQWIMERWRLPPMIVGMVSNHHTPNQAADRRETVNAVHIGDILARSLGIGSGGDRRIPAINAVVAANHLIDAEFLKKLLDAVVGEMNKAGGFLELISH
ncbi:MAG: HDOD domain-containing protein [Planctomycetota bacterium]|jgi:putative nucleotidyltransferase with HDIG domain|nr:HDOD domain-containing protein [Planctomycetota bacterium]